MEFPYNLPKEEVIRRIREIYYAEVDLENKNFDVYDQLLACEAVSESATDNTFQQRESERINVDVNGNGNGTYKLRVNSETTKFKLKAISELKKCDYRTPPKIIAEHLDVLLSNSQTELGWWLHIAQLYPPRRINYVIDQMIKFHKRGDRTINNPAAYFNYLIKYRKQRKSLGTIGGNKK